MVGYRMSFINTSMCKSFVLIVMTLLTMMTEDSCSADVSASVVALAVSANVVGIPVITRLSHLVYCSRLAIFFFCFAQTICVYFVNSFQNVHGCLLHDRFLSEIFNLCLQIIKFVVKSSF